MNALPILALSDNIRYLQILIFAGFLVCISLIVLVARDIQLRTRSLPLQICSILLAACIPFAGFLLYLAVRPARTLRQAENDRVLRSILRSLDEEPDDTQKGLRRADDI